MSSAESPRNGGACGSLMGQKDGPGGAGNANPDPDPTVRRNRRGALVSIMPPGSESNNAAPDDDWSDAPHTVQNVRFTHRGQHNYQVGITTDSHRVTVSISPQGRSVRVWLDGVPMQEEPAEVARYIERAVDGVR